MNKSKRDEEENKFFETINEGNIYQTTPSFVFTSGYSAGFAEAQAQAKVLVEALYFISNTSQDCNKVANKALEQYKEAVSGE